MPDPAETALTDLRAHLDALEVPWEEGTRPGETAVALPGERVSADPPQGPIVKRYGENT